MRIIIELIGVMSIGAIVYGVYSIYEPAAWIVAGGFGIGIASAYNARLGAPK